MGVVVIIGGGVAGAAAARRLRRRLDAKNRVILVEQIAAPYHPAVLPRVAAGRRSAEKLRQSITRLERHGIQVVVDRVKQIDLPARRIHAENCEIGYDLLIIAAGAEQGAAGIPGAAEAGLSTHTLEGAAEIRSRIENFAGEDIAILVGNGPIRYPAAPYAYAFLLAERFKREGRGRDISVTVFTPEPYPLALYGKRVGDAVTELLFQRHIRVHLNSRVERVDGKNNSLHLAHGCFRFDLLLYSPEATPPPLIRESGLGDATGWLPVDRHTVAAGQERILGAGDVTAMVTSAGGFLPKTGALAYSQALVAAENAARLLRGEKSLLSCKGRFTDYLDLGRGLLPFSGDFFAGNDFKPRRPSPLWELPRRWAEKRRWLETHS